MNPLSTHTYKIISHSLLKYSHSRSGVYEDVAPRGPHHNLPSHQLHEVSQCPQRSLNHLIVNIVQPNQHLAEREREREREALYSNLLTNHHAVLSELLVLYNILRRPNTELALVPLVGESW